MGRAGSGPEFRVNFESGLITSLVGRVGSGRVKKIGRDPRPTLILCVPEYSNLRTSC